MRSTRRSVSPDVYLRWHSRLNALIGNLFQRDVQCWLSPLNPSTNHKMALGQRLDGTGSWFTQSTTFQEWKVTGSLLWIHGKRMHVSDFSCTACPDCHLRHGLIAGSGKSILWYVVPGSFYSAHSNHRSAPALSKKLKTCVIWDWP